MNANDMMMRLLVYDELFPYACHTFLFFGYMRKEKRKQETIPQGRRRLERLAITQGKEHDKAHVTEQETRNF